MEKTFSNKLTIFLVAVIVVAAVLVMLKVFNGSYALPDLSKPVISDIQKTSDDPLQVQVKYKLTNVEDSYTISIINNTDAKTYSADVPKNEGDNEYYINDLSKGKTYAFTIKLCSDESNCIESDSKSIEIAQEQQTPTNPTNNENNQNTNTNVVGKVTNLRVTSITPNTISLSWNAASNANSYKLKYKKSSVSKWYEHNISGQSVKIKSLKPNTKYNIAVIGVKNGVKIDDKNWVYKDVITAPSVPAISGFKATAESYSKVKISWKKSSNKNVTYEIYRKQAGKSWKKIKTLGVNSTSYRDKGVSANTKYYYKMKAVDRKSQKGKTFSSNYTSTKTVKTPTKNRKTYIMISIKQQKLWFYKKGQLILTSKVVTGNKRAGHSTPKGTYKIRAKSRSAYLVGRDYVSFVNYWMLIDRGTQIGLHDATWRSKFGGSIYKSNGSHGCINLPFKTAKKIYSKAPTGTKVIVK